MKLKQLSDDVAFRTGIKIFFQILLVVVVMSNLFLSIALARADRTHRETMVPPQINKSFWVEDSEVSPDYLEQMGLFLLQLALNNTPASVDYNTSVLLRYAAPASYGELQKKQIAYAKELKEANGSSMFAVRSVTTSAKDMAVAFSGVFTKYIVDKRTSETSKTFLLRLGYSAGRVFILELRETDAKQPFAPVRS